MTLAIFDLDNTLLAGDSDHSWGEFLVEQDIVDRDHYRAENDRFYENYLAGKLDIEAYVAFVTGPIAKLSVAQRRELHQQFMIEKIEPMLLPKAQSLIEMHREKGHTLLIITATNSFITAPIAERLQIPHILATDPEIINEQFTGRIRGIPCFQKGKVTRLQDWLATRRETMDNSYFYSDSFNDLPLLKQVDNPVAVDPDPTLKRHAESSGWKIMSLR